MQLTIQEKINMLLAGSRRRRLLRKFVQVMCCIVVFVTTYMLILPAITLEQQTFCGMEEHSHATECYEPLVCGASSTECHVHTEDCYSLPEASAHIHSDACEDPVRGDLICTAEETPGHTHGSGCFEVSDILQCGDPENHIHNDSCRTNPLVCTLSTDPHIHTEGCFARGALICSQETGSGGSDEIHSHDDSCYESVTVCGMDTEPHIHGEACYSPEPELSCPLPENHTHENSCYQQNLICTTEETTGHSHSDDCYQWQIQYICGREEGEIEQPQPELICGQTAAEIHTHSDTCFINGTASCANTDPEHIHDVSCQNPVCGLDVHSHSLICYSDPDADTESRSVWEATFAHVALTGDWPTDVVAIAESQLGYTESTRNYDVWEDNTLHGYTRYGAWYGVPNGDWCGMFASFCLNYAGVEGMPYNYGVRPWIQELTQLGLYYSARETQPQKGNLIFFDWDEDGLGDHVGIVAEVQQAREHMGASVKTIEGNSSNAVRYQYYDPESSQILGYGLLPGQEMIPVQTAEPPAEDFVDKLLEILICGIPAHYHTDDCYYTEDVMICSRQEHTHTISCVDPSSPVGFVDYGDYMRTMMSARNTSKITYHTDIAPLFTGVVIRDSKNNVVYSSSEPGLGTGTVLLGEKCEITLRFQENTTNQFSDDDNDTYTYTIPSNFTSEIVGAGVITNRNGVLIGKYTINNDLITITPVLVQGKNYFRDFNNVYIEISFDAEVIESSDSGKTDIDFTGNFTVEIDVQENGTLISEKEELNYDKATQTITYKCTAKAHGGTVSLTYIDDWWWPDSITVLEDSIQITDAQGNDITDNWTYSLSEENRYFRMTPSSAVSLDHGEYITMTYQVKMKDGINENFTLNNTFAVHGSFGDKELYDEDTTDTPIQMSSLEKFGIYEAETVGDQVQDAVKWTVVIDNQNQETITVTDQLSGAQQFCTHKPLSIEATRQDGSKESISVNINDLVAAGSTTFTYELPTGYVRYVLTYYSHFEVDPNDPSAKQFYNTVTTNVATGDKTMSDTGVVEILGVVPGIRKAATSYDGNWITYTIECDMPAWLNGQSNVMLYDNLGSWGNTEGLILQNPDSMTVSITPVGGTTYYLEPYTNQESADNTYLLGIGGQTFNMYFNTSQASAETSVWKCETDSTLTITYRISMDTAILNGWGGSPTGETLREFLDRTGQGVSNEANLNYPSEQGKVTANSYFVPPKPPKPDLSKTAAETEDDGIYDYTVWFSSGDGDSCIFKLKTEEYEGKVYYKNEISSLMLTDAFDSRMQYVSGSFRVSVWDAWYDNVLTQAYELREGATIVPVMGEDGRMIMTVSASDLIGVGGSDSWLTGQTLLAAMQNLRGGYQYEFSYQLEIKEEIRTTSTDGVLELDNTASVHWTDTDGPKSVGPADHTIHYDTGILKKGMATTENSNIVDFDILVNQHALDLAAEMDTYILYDTMSSNLALIYQSIVVELLDTQSKQVTGTRSLTECQFTYDQDANRMTFILPDEQVIRLRYKCRVGGTGGQLTNVTNLVEIKGRSLIQDLVNTQFRVDDHQGSADANSRSFYLLKQDGDTHRALAGVEFCLYGDANTELNLEGHNHSVDVMINGAPHTLYHYYSHITDSSGVAQIVDTQLTSGHLYALIERAPPNGYVALSEPYLFYMDYRPLHGYPDIPIILDGELIVIQNFPSGHYELPETGGAGTEPYTAGGMLLILAAAMILLYNHTKCRKEDLNSS